MHLEKRKQNLSRIYYDFIAFFFSLLLLLNHTIFRADHVNCSVYVFFIAPEFNIGPLVFLVRLHRDWISAQKIGPITLAISKNTKINTCRGKKRHSPIWDVKLIEFRRIHFHGLEIVHIAFTLCKQKPNKINHSKGTHTRTHRVHYHSAENKEILDDCCFSAFCFHIQILSLLNTLWALQYAVVFPILRLYPSIFQTLFFWFFLSSRHKIEIWTSLMHAKPQIKPSTFLAGGFIVYLPRICVFCVQFSEIVPRIVWPDEYVCCGLSRMILTFSIFSSFDGDWSRSSVDDDIVAAVVVVIVLATGAGSAAGAGGPTQGVTVVISLELWLILQIETD